MYYVIVSGKKKSKQSKHVIENLKEKLELRKIEYKFCISEYEGHSIELAKWASQQDDCKAIIAVGGDGTFYEVLNGMDTKKIPLGLIPAGTGNDFARTLGIGLDIDECLDNIIGKEPDYVDYMKIGDKKAFNLIGTGFDIQLLKREKKLRKIFKSKISYRIALLQTILLSKFHKIKFRIDDGEVVEKKVFMVDCCNGKWGGGMLPLWLEADPFDGYIDFMYIDTFNKFKLLPLLLKFKKGDLPKTKYVQHYKCKKVEIEVESNLESNLDGELSHLFPNVIEIVHKELKIFKSLKELIDPYELLRNKKKRKKTA